MPQVHAHALTFYAQVARFCGLDPYRMLRRVGLRADVLTHPWLLIPMEPAAWLLEISARESGQAGFALLMVQGRVLSDLGPMSLLLEHEGTARDVINSLIRYQALLGERLAVAIDEEADTIVIRTELAAPFAGPQS
ncbi:MAG: AraC family transcriptional regulator ligand-binding domain-containing protein, partial [Sphingomonadaceae bacterium]|nr:AraC family transcriptional regulator ligand-binding domain-containing protein [Sphingomonadaceae bacterium]